MTLAGSLGRESGDVKTRKVRVFSSPPFIDSPPRDKTSTCARRFSPERQTFLLFSAARSFLFDEDSALGWIRTKTPLTEMYSNRIFEEFLL